LSGRGAAW